MSDIIDFDNKFDNDIIDFSQPEGDMSEAQKERERELQQKAMIEPTADYSGIRNSLAQAHKDEEDVDLYEDVERLLVNGADAQKINKDLSNYHNTFNATDSLSSLEVEAGRKEAEQALQNNDTTRLNALADPLTYDSDIEAAKQEIEESFRKRVADYLDNGNTWSKVVNPAVATAIGGGVARELSGRFPKVATAVSDIVINALPFYTPIDIQTIGEKSGIEIASLTTGERQRDDYLAHRAFDTPEQFAQYLNKIADELDRTSPTAISEYLKNIEGTIDTSNDYWNTLDLLGAVGDAFGVVKGLKGGFKSEAWAAKKIGDMKKANDIIVEAVKKGTDAPTILEDAVTNSATQPFQSQGIVAQSNAIAKEIADVASDKELMKRIDFARESSKFTPEEMEVAKNVVRDRVKADLVSVNNSIVDVQAVDITPDIDGGYRAILSIGGGLDGKLGMNKRVAEKLAQRIGLTPDEYMINKKTGQGYYIDINRPLKTDELTLIGADEDLKKPDVITRYLAGTLNISDKMHQKDITAFRAELGLNKYLQDSIKSFKSLSSNEQKAMSELYYKGVTELNNGLGGWFDPVKLKEDGYSDNFIKTYTSFKKISDVDYFINNDFERRAMKAQGYKLLDDRQIAKVVNVTPANFRKITIKDFDSYDKLKKELDKGAQVVEIHRSNICQERLTYTHKLIRPNQNTLKELPRYVTPYQGGGRREYTLGTAFVKMGTTLKEGVNGFARTLTAGNDKALLQQYANEINTLVDIMKNTDSDIEKTRKIVAADFQHLNVIDAAEAKKLLRTPDNPHGFIDTNYRAQVLEDEEMYKFGNENPSIYDGTEHLHDALDDLVRMREETFNGRGVLLDQLGGRKRFLVNYKDIFDQTIHRAAYTDTLGELYRWYQREFRRVFGSDIKDSRYMSDADLILADLDNTDVFATKDINKINAAKNFQQHYQRLTYVKTGLDKAIDRSLDYLARYIGDKHILGLDRSSKAVQAIAKADPLSAARTYEAYRVLAGNASQLWKQPLDLLSTAMSHPINLTRAIVLAPVALRAMQLHHQGKSLGALKQIYGKTLGVDLERLAKYLDVFASTEMVGKMDPVLRQSSRSRYYKSLLIKTLMTPFNIGQGTVNVLADIVAFLDKPHATFKEITQHADDLTKNMTKISESAMQYGQKFGVDKLFSQWTSYKTHSIESIFNKRLTKRERLAIAVSNFVILGGISNLGDRVATNFYQKAVKSTDFTPEEIEGMSKGFLHLAGKELGIDFSEDIGVGDSIDKIFDLLDADVDTQLKFGDMFPNVKNMFNLVQPNNWNIIQWCVDMYRGKVDVFDMYNLAERYAKDPESAVGIKNASRAYVMWKTGMYFNSHREPLDSAGYDLDNRKKWMYNSLLGLAPYQRYINNFEYNLNKIRNDLKRDALKDLKEIADQIHQYQDTHPEDSRVDDENMSRLYKEFDTTRRGYSAAFQEDFGSVFANEFMRDSWSTLNKSEAGSKNKRRTERYDTRMFKVLHGDKD